MFGTHPPALLGKFNDVCARLTIGVLLNEPSSLSAADALHIRPKWLHKFILFCIFSPCWKHTSAEASFVYDLYANSIAQFRAQQETFQFDQTTAAAAGRTDIVPG